MKIHYVYNMSTGETLVSLLFQLAWNLLKLAYRITEIIVVLLYQHVIEPAACGLWGMLKWAFRAIRDKNRRWKAERLAALDWQNRNMDL